MKQLKKESMNLLNKTYQDFGQELQVLDHDIYDLEEIYSKSVASEKTDLEMTERLNSLSELEARLELKLEEAKSNVEEIGYLDSQLQTLQQKIDHKNHCQETKMMVLNSDFMEFIKNLETRMNMIVDTIIQDKELKLHLLPMPYQALFLSGQLGTTWCNSVLESCEGLLEQNAETEKRLEHLRVTHGGIHDDISKTMMSLVLCEHVATLEALKRDRVQLNEDEKAKASDLAMKHEMQAKYIEQLKKMVTKLEQDIKSLWKKLIEVENVIMKKETSELEFSESSHMLKLILQAKDVIIKEL